MIRVIKPALSKAPVAPNAEEPQEPHGENPETFPVLAGSRIKRCARVSGEWWWCGSWMILAFQGDRAEVMLDRGLPCSLMVFRGRRVTNSVGGWSTYSWSQRLQRGAKLGGSCCVAMWDRPSLLVTILSCYFSAGLKNNYPTITTLKSPRVCF